jgi:integrase
MTPHHDHDHDHTSHSDGERVRVSGIKTEAAERVLPMLPALYDVLIDHKAEFGYGAHAPVSPRAMGGATPVDNVRRAIVDLAVVRANELLVARGQIEIVRCTPHALRRTFASIFAEVTCRRAARCTSSGTPTRR